VKSPFKLPVNFGSLGPMAFKALGLEKLKRKLVPGDDAVEDEDKDAPLRRDSGDARASGPDDDLGDDLDIDSDAEGVLPGRRMRLLLMGGAVVIGLSVTAGAALFFLSGGKTPVSRAVPGVPFVRMEVPPPRVSAGSGVLTQAAGGPQDAMPSVNREAFESIAEVPVEAPLSEAPDPNLIEQGAQGPLPKVAEDGRKPWQVYARPAGPVDDRPRISIIITGLGLSYAATEAAITRLPGKVTLAFSPYARRIDNLIALARRSGHEVLLSLPMETVNFPIHDPGPYALNSIAEPTENLRRLNFILSRFSGYVGVISPAATQVATIEEQIKPVLQSLHGRGLMYVDATSGKNNLAPRIAVDIGMPRVIGDIILDRDSSRADLDRELEIVETIVRRKSVALIIADSTPAILDRLNAWIKSLEEKNLALAPVSAIANKQFLE